MLTAHEIVVAALDRHPHELVEAAPLHVYSWNSNKSLLIRNTFSPYRFYVTVFTDGGDDSDESDNVGTRTASHKQLTAMLDLLADGTL